MKSVLILGTTLATTFAAGPTADRRLGDWTSRHLGATAWNGGNQDHNTHSSCQFKSMENIFKHTFSGDPPTVPSPKVYYATDSQEAKDDPHKDESKRYPMLIGEWSNKLKLDNKVDNEGTYQYYIFNEQGSLTPKENDWVAIPDSNEEYQWDYCAYRTSNVNDGTTGSTSGSPDGNGRYECGENMCVNDITGEDGTAAGKKNCQDLTLLGTYSEESHYENATADSGENYVHVDKATWTIAERVTIGVSTKCGNNGFNQKSHIFAWATLSSTASYSLATKETDTDFGTAEVDISATESYGEGGELIWIHGDQPQQTSDITSGITTEYTFQFSGSLTSPHVETDVTTSCGLQLTIGNTNIDYQQNCFDSDTTDGTYVDGPGYGTCTASMITTCTRTSDSNAEGTNIFDHAALTDTRTWDVRIDSAIVQAILVTNSRRIVQDDVTAAQVMELHDELNSAILEFNATACNGSVTNSPCLPWEIDAAKAQPIYPVASNYACDGDCASKDPFVVLSGFYDHNMVITCPGTTEYQVSTTCHLTGGDDILADDDHTLTHGSVHLLRPPGNDPLFYVFGIANFGDPTNEKIAVDLDNNVNNNRRLRSALSKDVKLGGGIISTVAPHRNSVRAN